MDTEDEGREAKKRVREKYPRAFIGPNRIWPTVKVVYKDVSDHAGIGRGDTFDEAWIDAARHIR